MDDPEMQEAFAEFQRDISDAYGDIPMRREEESQMLLAQIQAIGQQNAAVLQQAMSELNVTLARIQQALQQVLSEQKKKKNIKLENIKTDAEGNVTSADAVSG
jgi:hypothetical protein